MPIAIGRPSPRNQSTEPAELLLECHERIRQAMRGARGLVSVPAGDPAIAPTAAAVHRYFVVALPLHAQDEDESLAPRLFAAGVPDEIADAVQAMTAQHTAIDAVLARLLPLWERLETEPSALAECRDRLAEDTAELQRLWDVHLGMEEETIFPRVAHILSERERSAVVEEMRRRRQAH